MCVCVGGGGYVFLDVLICMILMDFFLYPVCLFIIIILTAFDIALFIKLSSVCVCVSCRCADKNNKKKNL